MDILMELQNEKNKILSAISKAANEGKTDFVLVESEKLEKIKNLITRYDQIVLELEGLRNDNSPIPPRETNKVATGGVDESHSSRLIHSRKLGEKIRNEFLKKLKDQGIHLQSIKGKALFCTKSGKRVGLAVATERQPNRWFLGLPVRGFDHAVLLCQRESGDVIEILLPEKFFAQHGKGMSQSKGQLKFNIISRGSNQIVQVPGTEGINWKSFASDYSFLL